MVLSHCGFSGVTRHASGAEHYYLHPPKFTWDYNLGSLQDGPAGMYAREWLVIKICRLRVPLVCSVFENSFSGI